MEVTNKYILVFVFTIFFNNMVYGDGDEYARTKVDLMKKALKAFTDQKETIEKIKKKSDLINKQGNMILDDFMKHTSNLRPALSHKATEPFLKIIQDYLNNFTEMRQDAIVSLKKIEIHKERAIKEFTDSEKIYIKISKLFRESTDNKKVVESTSGQVKSLMVTRDRLNEINSKITNLEKSLKDYSGKILFATKKIVSYRYLLELVTKGRNAIVSSKNIYIDSFGLKDRILFGFNRVQSISKKGKLLVGEARKRGLYKVDLDKIESLLGKIKKLDNKINNITKNSIKNWESLKDLVAKMEQNENSITEVGSNNKKTPNTGYTKAKSYYNIIVKLRKMIEEINKSLKNNINLSSEIVKEANKLFREIDIIIKRKTVLIRKVPMLVNPLKVKVEPVNTKTKELKDVKSSVSASDNEIEIDSDSDSEDEYELSENNSKKSGDKKDKKVKKKSDSSSSESEYGTASEGEENEVVDILDGEEKDVDVGDLSKRTKKKRTRAQLEKNRKAKTVNDKKDKKVEKVKDVTASDSSTDSGDGYETVDEEEKKKSKKGKSKVKRVKIDDEPEFKLKKKGKLGKAFGFIKSIVTGKSDKEDEIASRLVKLEPTAPSADQDSDVDGLKEKQRVKLELETKLDKLNVSGDARGDVLKLIELAYALKNQFELVRKEFQDSARFKAIQLIRRILMESLHMYLTGVCTVVLEITRTSAKTGILPTTETATELVTKM